MMADKIALLLTIIGAVNRGLIGIFQFDLVSYIFGGQGGRCSAASCTRRSARRGCGAFPCCSGIGIRSGSNRIGVPHIASVPWRSAQHTHCCKDTMRRKRQRTSNVMVYRHGASKHDSR